MLKTNDGHFVYTLDDTYIHMAMAKNLSQHGVWGVTKYEFTSASSSLFWTAFLAFLYLITGPNEIAPFLISLISGILLLFPFYFFLKKEGVKPLYTFIILLILILMVNLPYYVITGLEHPLHALITILFVLYSAEIVSGLRNKTIDSVVLLILAFMLPLLRYEGLVSILLLFILLLLQRKYLLSASVFLAGTLPISIFGLISINHGWSFFPHSMIMKWKFPDVTSPGSIIKFMSDIVVKILTPINISLLLICLVLLAAGYYYFKKHKNEFSNDNIRDAVLVLFYIVDAVLYYIFSMSNLSPRYQHFLIVMAIFVSAFILLRRTEDAEGNKKLTVFLVPVLIAVFTAIIFEETKIPLRYQRYAIFIGTIILAFSIFSKNRRIVNNSNKKIKIAFQAMGIMILFSLIIFLERPPNNATINVTRNSTNIYEQQYQTAQFLKRFYQGKEIAVNDIGAPGYFADIKMIDLWGLADIETAKMRRDNDSAVVSKDNLEYLAHSRNIKIAVVYDAWFTVAGKSVIPEQWIKAGKWKILNNIVCASDEVTLYAVDVSEKDNLINNLRLNSAFMPPDIIQTGAYTEKLN